MKLDELISGLTLTDDQRAQLASNLAAIEDNRLKKLADDTAQAEQGSIMTKAGLDILMRGAAGKKIIYTRVAIGDALRDGEVVQPSDAEVLDMTSLIHFKKNLPIADCKFSGNGTMTVQSLLANVDWANPFWFRELGLFAKIEGDDDDVLYSYRNTGLLSPYLPSGRGAVILNLILNLVTVVDNATNIYAVIDASLLYVNQAQFIEHINSACPHPNIPQLQAVLTTAPVIWSSNDDNQLHPITFDDFANQLFSDEAAPIHAIKSRVAQAETNLANLFMQLDSLLEVGLTANLLIFEDFIDCAEVDTLRVKVEQTAGGPNDLYVENLNGILVGHYYTVSDGNRSQFLRVQSVNTNGELSNVVFDSPITRTFNLKKTYLRRTTAAIKEGHVDGSGDEHESTFRPDDVWQGIQSSTTKTVAIKTTQANAANFDLTGDYAFDANGFFTLA